MTPWILSVGVMTDDHHMVGDFYDELKAEECRAFEALRAGGYLSPSLLADWRTAEARMSLAWDVYVSLLAPGAP
jgi:hypothetical protein